jgi:hypothetical protein
MNFSRQTLAAALLCVLAALSSEAAADAPVCVLGREALSATEPPVERPHLFCGEVNRRDRGTGFHHRPGGENPPTARFARIVERNAATGVYVADGIEIFDGEEWRRKRTISSFYPDSCAPAEVLASVAHAASNATCGYPNGKWRGPSAPGTAAEGYCLGEDGSVLTLEGYWRSEAQRIVRTAWPLVDPDPAPAACR